jgi:probable HAF family extracellular repeat protein
MEGRMTASRSLYRKALHGTGMAFMLPVLAALGAWTDVPMPRYRVVDLGTLGGATSNGEAINERGQVAGWSDTAGGNRHAFLYSDGTMQDLGTLTGGSDSYATALNDRGQVVGYSGINGLGQQFPEIYQGFVWDQDGMKSLGALFCPCSYNDRYGASGGYTINDKGWIGGDSETVRGSWVLHATFWRDGSLQDLGGGAGDWSISRLFGLNTSGVAVGDYAANAGQQDVFNRQASLWRSGARTDLGTLPGDLSSTALAVNVRGMTVGWSGTSNGSVSHAFIWSGGSMHDLGALHSGANSAALAIDALGDVVGWADASDGTPHAFLWRAGHMQDLNQSIPEYSGWVLLQASGINRRGEITGTGLHDGQTHAFLLTSSEGGDGGG